MDEEAKSVPLTVRRKGCGSEPVSSGKWPTRKLEQP
jgi:hypothetical protein